jgi:hypothetical protein
LWAQVAVVVVAMALVAAVAVKFDQVHSQLPPQLTL